MTRVLGGVHVDEHLEQVTVPLNLVVGLLREEDRPRPVEEDGGVGLDRLDVCVLRDGVVGIHRGRLDPVHRILATEHGRCVVDRLRVGVGTGAVEDLPSRFG